MARHGTGSSWLLDHLRFWAALTIGRRARRCRIGSGGLNLAHGAPAVTIFLACGVLVGCGIGLGWAYAKFPELFPRWRGWFPTLKDMDEWEQ